jgi:DNA primase
VFPCFRPGLNTAAVIEHFRDTEYQTHLAKLAVWQHLTLQHDVDAEFSGLMSQMRREAVRNRIAQLTGRSEALSPSEKDELARLLLAKSGAGATTSQD